MKTILTYGTFDLLHVGHVRLLRRARAMGDRLVVGCSTDEFNLVKGKSSLYSFSDRQEILQACRFVDVVIPESSWEQKLDDIRRHDVSVLAIGEDWKGHFDDLETGAGITVTYLSRTSGVSTTYVKDVLASFDRDKKVYLQELVSKLSAEIENL